MLSEIDNMDTEEFLANDPERLTEFFFQKYNFLVPQLQEDELWRDQEQEVDIKPRNGMPLTSDLLAGAEVLKGFRYIFHVPFDGHPAMFRFAPSTQTTSGPPSVYRLEQDELVIAYYMVGAEAEVLERALYADLDSIRKHLNWLAEDFSRNNPTLLDAARNRIEARLKRLQRKRAVGEKLQIPLKRRNPPEAYKVPIVRRETPVVRRQQDPSVEAPEWILEDKQYEHIISVMEGMASVMEQSPDAFRRIGEEAIRWHFVLVLNGHYEGGASGETFNAGGKTDILVQWERKVAFIAECKIWDGASSLEDAVDQLFGYVTWHNTRTAILLFNRNENFSRVLDQIPSIVEEHESFKERLLYKDSKTAFRFRLRHPRDPEHELMLTILAFDVPT